MPLSNLFIFGLGAIALAFSSSFLVNSLIRVSEKLHISEFLVGFALMAVATSIPGLFIGIISALSGDPTISLGNVLGANIADLSLITGTSVFVAGGLVFQSTIRKEEMLYLNLAAIAPLVFLLEGTLNRAEGAVLVLFFIFYIYDLAFHSKAYHRVVQDQRESHPLGFELALFALGLAVLLAAANAVVGSGVVFAQALRIPTILVGIIILALGTTLPDLSFSLASVKRNVDLLFGDVMGSVVTNSTLVLGVTALIHPIHIDGASVFFVAAAALIITLATFSNLLRSGKFTVRDSLILIFGYLLFAAVAIFAGTPK